MTIPAPYFQSGGITVHQGDCLDVLRQLPDSSVHAVVTDPPYGLANTTPAQVAETLTAWISGDREYLPTGKGFMGKPWDAFVPPIAVWDECLRVLKPGGHVLAFAGSRTHDLMTLGIRLAGFDIRDSIAWLYASGFPKSRNVSGEMAEYLERGPQGVDDPDRPIDSRLYEITGFLRAARDAAGWTNPRIDGLFGTNGMAGHWTSRGTQPACPSVRQWAILREQLGFGSEMDELVAQLAATERPEDWGTTERDEGFLATLGSDYDASHTVWGSALKPSHEPVVVGRKPALSRGSLAEIGSVSPAGDAPRYEPIILARKPFPSSLGVNVLEHGTGALHIGANRIPIDPGDPVNTAQWVSQPSTISPGTMGFVSNVPAGTNLPQREEGLGRWPANVLLDDTAASEIDRQSGMTRSAPVTVKAGTLKSGANGVSMSTWVASRDHTAGYDDVGGASRFFPVFRYVPKAGSDERPIYELEGGGTATQNYGEYKIRVCAACGSRANKVPCPECGATKHTLEEPLNRRPGFVAHPTVKPLDLMRWLVRLVCPPGGTVLEPFAGSGTTVEACALEGFACIAVEREPTYLPLILQRIGKPLEVGLDLDWDPEPETAAAPPSTGPQPVPRGNRATPRRQSVAAATLDAAALDFGDWEAEA